MTSRNKTIGLLVFVAAVVTTLLLINYNKDNEVDDYDWIMW